MDCPSPQMRRYLTALFDRARPGTLIEIRWRTPASMSQEFVAANDLTALEPRLMQLAPITDVYVGVLQRWRCGGGRGDVVGDCRMVWVDCDAADSASALMGIDPQPHLVIASGTADYRHAYWRLSRSYPPAVIERANRRLAWALGGDLGSSDAARILRPPATLNHKSDPAAPVTRPTSTRSWCRSERSSAGSRTRRTTATAGRPLGPGAA